MLASFGAFMVSKLSFTLHTSKASKLPPTLGRARLYVQSEIVSKRIKVPRERRAASSKWKRESYKTKP